MKTKLYKEYSVSIKSVDPENAIIEGIFSTEDEDRHGDIVRQNWDLKKYKLNPVILDSHNYWSATDVIGIAEKIGIKDGKLAGKIKFAVQENPVAKVIYDLYAGGFLKAFSVGFIPKEFSASGEILKSELLEISAVSVPANAMALAKGAGVDLKPLFKGIIDALEEEKGEEVEIDEEEQEDVADEQLVANTEEETEELEEEKEEIMGCPVDRECKKDEEEDIEEEVEEVEEEEDVIDNLDKMLKLVKATGEKLKAETLRQGVRADANRLLNKTIRELIKIKK